MAADAAINTALATGAGAASVSSGGCFADCPTGTVCNHATGLCDALPCHGQCKDGEVCDEAGLVPRCVQVNGPVVNRQAGAPPPPDATPAAAAAPTAPASAPPPASPAAPAAYPSDAPTR